jgi:hypothetical protein
VRRFRPSGFCSHSPFMAVVRQLAARAAHANVDRVMMDDKHTLRAKALAADCR